MNRRSFIAALGAFALVPSTLRRLKPSIPRDDTDYVQGVIDSGGVVPPGDYYISRTLVLADKGAVVDGNTFHFCFPNQPAFVLGELGETAPWVHVRPNFRGSFCNNFLTSVGPPSIWPR